MSLDFSAALAQLLHHVVEVAAEVSDFVVAAGEADGNIEITFADLGDFLLQLDHWPLNEIGERADGNSADDNSSGPGNEQNRVAFGIAKRDGRNDEQQQTCQEHEDHRQESLDLPIDANRVQIEILSLIFRSSRRKHAILGAGTLLRRM